MSNAIVFKPLTPALRDSPTRHRREGLLLAHHGAARVLTEAEQAPDNRKRIAAWRNRYATVPLELTL